MLLVFALLVWPLAAFGGTSASTALPHAAVCVLGLLVVRPHLGGSLDRALLVLVALVELQMVALPLVGLLSPNARALGERLTVGGREASIFYPITIDVPSTGWALAVLAGAISIFWIARTQFSAGGVRLTTRMLAALGFAVSLLAIAQATTAGRRIYWRFPTEFEGPLPFGPFINRNHFATWVIMAIPLCFGYLIARLGSRGQQPDHAARRSRFVRSIDPRTAWLLSAGGTMLVALLLSLSRSGVAALGVSAMLTFVVARHRVARRQRRTLLVATAVILLVGLAWADIPALRQRVAGTETGLANRIAIWRETVPIIRDFWVTGTGAGTFQRAMYAYQQSDRSVFFNQAHNHYLQAMSEGGVIVTGAIAFALVAFAGTARRRIAGDASGLVWIRIGAACGLGAVALQSIWETGLVMPANAALAAVLAAIVVHERRE